MTEFYFVNAMCECGEEACVISSKRRIVMQCECGRYLDLWPDQFLLDGTEEDVIDWMNDQ